MNLGERTTRQRILKFSYVLMIVLFVTFLIALSESLAGKGLDTQEILNQISVYGWAIAYAIILILAFTIELFTNKGDKLYGDSIAFADHGESPLHWSIFKKVSIFQMFLGSMVIFGFAALGALFTKQQTFTGLPAVSQQFTPAGKLMFDTLVIPGAENLGAAALIAVLLIFIRYLARKNDYSSFDFKAVCWILIPISVGIYGVVNHVFRYGSIDFNLVVVFFFWFIGAGITLFTGSFIPFWIMHGDNNFINNIKNVFSADISQIIMIAGVLLLTALYFFMYNPFRTKKQGMVVE